MFKLLVPYSSREEISEILDRTTAGVDPKPEPVIDGKGIEEGRKLVRKVVIAPHVKDYAIRLVLATHPGSPYAVDLAERYVRFGASPRGAQAVTLAAKTRALLDGRYHASFDDVARSYLPSMRHRIIMNFEGEAEGVENDDILKQILERVERAPKEASEAK